MIFVIFSERVDENSQYKHDTSQKRSRRLKCNYPLVYCVKKKTNVVAKTPNKTLLKMNGAMLLGKIAMTKQTSLAQDQLSLIKILSKTSW